MIARLITNLGDSALLIPAGFGLAAYLAAHGERRILLGFGIASAICVGSLGIGKLVFQSCHLVTDLLAIRSPSGHAAMSTLAYGSLAFVAGRGRPTWVRSLMAGLAMAVAALVGASRVTLGAHTSAEVVAGWSIGLLSILAMRLVSGTSGSPLRLHALAYGAAICIVLTNGQHLSPEPTIRRIAQWASGEGLSCPWSPPRDRTLAGLTLGSRRDLP